jgi:rare lipoprotein A
MPVRRRHVLVPLLAAAATAVASPVAHAQAPTPSAGSTGGAVAAPEPEMATAAVGAVSVSTPAGAMLRRTARFSGAIPASDAGRVVTIERLDELTSQWLPVAHATAGPDGGYLARWKADRVGRLQVRARVESPDVAAASAAPQLEVTVFRTAVATWYGPGFWGHKTACGTRLRRSTYGVAHKTLKCGTQVTLFYKGRTVTVPVIDRGPFRKGTKWDLTQATARAIGFQTTDTVGTLRAQPAG